VTDTDVVREFYARAINARDASACNALLTEDFVHNGEPRGRDGQRAAVQAFLDAFSPLVHEILILFAEGDLVCAHQRWSGTQIGPFAGHAASGREVVFTSTAILRIRDAQIAQAWDELDLAGLLAQIDPG
jgi:predicted ester cyclase